MLNCVIFSTNIYLLKVNNNRNTTTKCEICSNLTIKTPERRQWYRSGASIINFVHISHLFLVLLLLLWIAKCLLANFWGAWFITFFLDSSFDTFFFFNAQTIFLFLIIFYKSLILTVTVSFLLVSGFLLSSRLLPDFFARKGRLISSRLFRLCWSC